MTPRQRRTLVLAFGVLILLNLVTFSSAYRELFAVDSGCCAQGRPLARDFSAYYVGAWRLFHDPSHVYASGTLSDGGPSVGLQPEAFKYLPSFLLMTSPLLLLGYSSAMVAFDAVQLLLLPAMAMMVYALVKGKGVAATFVVAMLVLLQPSPTAQWSLSVSYFWQWGEGQAKVLQTFLLLLSFYLGSSRKPGASGALLGLAAFDPRFALLSLPLFLTYNAGRLRAAVGSALGAFLLTNAPLLYPGMGQAFLEMVLSSGIRTPLYYYAFIPLLTVVSLTVVNRSEVMSSLSRLGRGTRAGEAPTEGLPGRSS